MSEERRKKKRKGQTTTTDDLLSPIVIIIISSYLVASSAPIPLERLLPPMEGSPEEGEAAAPGARGLAPLARSAWWREEEEVAAVSSSASSSSSTTPPLLLLLAGDRAPSPLPDHRMAIFFLLFFASALRADAGRRKAHAEGEEELSALNAKRERESTPFFSPQEKK